jgi:hypothetical protein
MVKSMMIVLMLAMSGVAFAQSKPDTSSRAEPDTKPGNTLGVVNWCEAYPDDHWVKTGRSTCPSRSPNKR